VLLLGRLGIDLVRLYRIRRNGLPWPGRRELVESVSRTSGVGRKAEILLHEEIAAPLTYGLWRSVILLPSEAREWSEADLRRAITHELEHVRRSDWVIQLAARVTSVFYWFHPLVWIALRRLSLEAERTCDDAVIQRAERTEYADQLVSLARRLKVQAHPALGMANRSDLAARVAALLDGSQRRGRSGLAVAAAAFSVACLVVLAIAPVRAVSRSRSSDRDSGGVERAETQHGADAQSSSSVSQSQKSAESQANDTRLLEKVKGIQQTSKLDWNLFEASEDGRISVMVELIAAGANVNAAIDGDGSPLIAAARAGHLEAVKLLLDRGANPNLAVLGDGSPLIMAANAGHAEIVSLLLELGADPNLAVSGDGNPLINAASAGHARVVSMLLNGGADPNLGVPGDGNALIMAASSGHAEIVQLLLDRGANIDQVVPGDENALIRASENGNLKVVKLLVSRGADVNARVWVKNGRSAGETGEWRTPLSMARKNGHQAVVDFLQASGARE
jgi:ankyrin repeat protein